MAIDIDLSQLDVSRPELFEQDTLGCSLLKSCAAKHPFITHPIAPMGRFGLSPAMILSNRLIPTTSGFPPSVAAFPLSIHRRPPRNSSRAMTGYPLPPKALSIWTNRSIRSSVWPYRLRFRRENLAEFEPLSANAQPIFLTICRWARLFNGSIKSQLT